MTWSVRVLRRADRDLQQISDFIQREAPRRVGVIIERLLDAIGSLETMPERGSVPRDSTLASQSYRVLVHRDYLVFYKVLRRTVRVYRVLHGHRAYRGLL